MCVYYCACIKRFTYILLSLLGLFLFLLLFGYLVLQNKKLQHSAVDALTQSLSQQVGSKVSICEIDWNFPNSFVLKNVYIEDLNRDTLLYMDRTKVTINLLRLLSSKISFRTIQFTGLRANLTVDSTQTHNYQFFVDAFQSNDNDTLSLNWTMDIESMAFDDCEISYRNQYKDNDENRIGRFNPNDMDFYDLNGCIFVRSFLEDSVNIIMEGIKVKEKSGLVIDDVHTALSMNRNNLTLKNFSVKTPNSQLNVSEAVAYHNNYEAFEDPKNRLRAQLTIEESTIKPSDFSVFKPSLDMLRENLSLKGSAYGKLSDFQVFDFQAKYGDATTFSGDAFVQHAYPNVEDLVLQANLHRISSNATELSDILFTLLEREVQLPELIDSLGVFAYEGSLNGGLKNLVSKGRVSSNVGAIDIAIVMKTNDLLLNNYHIVGNIRSDNNHLDRLFGRQSGLGNSAFGLDIILDKISDQKFRLNAEGVIDSFYYKNYCYRDIRLNGVFDNDAFDGSLILSDENADVSFLGKLDLRKEKPLFHFSANVDNFNLTKTNLVETEEDAVLSFNVETNFVGNDLDDMEGVFSMDNVVFRQGDKEVGVNSLSLSAVSEGNGRKELSFFSDYLNGAIIGRYFFASLPARLHNLAHHYMPAVVKETKDVIQPDDRGNDFKFDFTIENLEAIHVGAINLLRK